MERAQGTRQEGFPWSRPVHPSDTTPIAAAAVELASDCLAVTAAIVGRVAWLPAMPRGVRVAQTLVELERPLRRRLKRRIGPIGTDTVLALTAAAVQGLSQGPGMPAVDALYRLELLAEALSRRAVWERREGQLCCTPEALPREAPVRPPRPRPRPDGPIEAWAERLGPGALGAAGLVLALTRHPGRAADMLLVAVPKAARRGREGFATTVGRELARRGVVPLNAAAWRRLDRISAIVLDSPLLCTGRPQILGAEPAGGVDAAALWQAAARRLSRSGVLVRSSRTLEALGRVDVVCFDKTGTLTEGRPAVTRLAWSDAELEHPHAHGLLDTAARACPPAQPQETPQGAPRNRPGHPRSGRPIRLPTTGRRPRRLAVAGRVAVRGQPRVRRVVR